MRAFLRHPSEFPIELSSRSTGPRKEPLENVSEGGLCCHSSERLDVGTSVRIKIAIGDGFEADGAVAWCAKAEEDDGYRVGISFADHASAFSVRMVQQVCQIERYRTEVKLREGREIDAETAAREWIARYAASFPR